MHRVFYSKESMPNQDILSSVNDMLHWDEVKYIYLCYHLYFILWVKSASGAWHTYDKAYWKGLGNLRALEFMLWKEASIFWH